MTRYASPLYVPPGAQSGPTGQGLSRRGVGGLAPSWGAWWWYERDLSPVAGGVGNPNEHGQRWSLTVGARALPFSKAEELNTQVVALDVDVDAWAQKQTGGFPPPADLDAVKQVAQKFKSQADADFWVAWLTFRLEWRSFFEWRRDNPPPWWSPIPSDAMTEAYGDLPKYDALLARWEALLATAKKLGVGTKVETPDQGSLLDQAADSLGEGLGKGLGDAGKALGELGTYALVGALVVGGLYLVGPALVAAAGKAVRR